MEQETIYKYRLPNDDTETNTKNHSLILVGANGSGKSRLGIWFERNYPENTHRISSQKSLVFQEDIQQQSYEKSINLLVSGDATNLNVPHDRKYRWDGTKYNYFSSFQDDFNIVLSALLASHSKDQSEYIDDCKYKDSQGIDHDPVPEMAIDILKRIWTNVFPHRNIAISDGKVIATYQKENSAQDYYGFEMSDGEKVALYLIAQVICTPPNRTIIVDEPELHLHPSIMNKLWSQIEKERRDCFFIYITHDTRFASNHPSADIVWIKSYDGEKWDYEKVLDSQMPKQLLLDILGNRKKVLFVEGTSGSFDTKLYAELYKDYYIVPCGSCKTVIERTKSMRSSPQLHHHLECYGIIDLDYRSDIEISSYAQKGIFTLSVSEVESLFLVEELLFVVNKTLGFEDNSRVEKVKNTIIKRFADQLNKQISSAINALIKYKLETVDVTGISVTDTEELSIPINIRGEKKRIQDAYTSASESGSYRDILKLYNDKSLLGSIGHYFGLTNKDYSDYVLRQLSGANRQKTLEALSNYLPSDIPR